MAGGSLLGARALLSLLRVQPCGLGLVQRILTLLVSKCLCTPKDTAQYVRAPDSRRKYSYYKRVPQLRAVALSGGSYSCDTAAQSPEVSTKPLINQADAQRQSSRHRPRQQPARAAAQSGQTKQRQCPGHPPPHHAAIQTRTALSQPRHTSKRWGPRRRCPSPRAHMHTPNTQDGHSAQTCARRAKVQHAPRQPARGGSTQGTQDARETGK